jgi:hypothetical protein
LLAVLVGCASDGSFSIVMPTREVDALGGLDSPALRQRLEQEIERRGECRHGFSIEVERETREATTFAGRCVTSSALSR